MTISRSELARYIDHTLLKPEATAADVQGLLTEAKELNTFSICVSPSQLPVKGADPVAVATVCGFPSGKHTSVAKVAEAAESVRQGADEVDMVIDIGMLKEGRDDDLTYQIRQVKAVVPGVLKVIIESAALTDAEIVRACKCSEEAGADFVKTSTGFHPAGGASVHAVKLMADTVGGRLGVKASGGIRDYETAVAMIEAGATRLGLSASAAVLAGAK